MEKENHRVNKMNCNQIRNHERNECTDLKEPYEEKITQRGKHFKIGLTRNKGLKYEEYKKENEELSSPWVNSMFGLCAICHLTVGNLNSTPNDNIPCSKGHALCQRCIQHFTVQSDRGCILCQAHNQSSINLSRESNMSLSSTHKSLKRTETIRRPQSDYSHSRTHRTEHYQPVNLEKSNSKSRWNQTHSYLIPNVEEKTNSECYSDDFTENSDYEQERSRYNLQEERMKDNMRLKQHLSEHSFLEKEHGVRYVCETKVNGQITTECSRRPIRCPRIDCAINVAFSALTHHFIFDHPEVPILNVDPGIKSTHIVSFNALSSNCSRCLALLLVSGKLSEPAARFFNSNQISPKYRNRLPLSVLAARLQCNDGHISNEMATKKNLQEKNIIIAWVAGLDVGNTREKLLCSIQAVDKIDNEGLRCLTYTGPVNSLRTAQCPQDIFSTGDCIVLHEGLLGHITSDCAMLNINVTVH